MSHTRFKLGFVRHKKVYKLGDAAFRLWVSAMDHAREQLTDGALTDSDLDIVPHCPSRGPKRKAIVAALVDSGLWERTDDGWQVHDFLDWQDSANQVLTKLEQARERMRVVRENDKRTKHERAREVRSTDHIPSPDPDRKSETGSGSSDARDPEPDDPGRETPCPLDLESRLEANGAMASLAEKLVQPIDSIRHEIRQFVAYWTIGKGASQRRTGWPGKARQWVVDKHGKGEIVAPGAAQHASRAGKRGGRRDDDDAPVAPSPLLAMMPGGVR